MSVKFDRKWFNPLYFILCESLKVHSIRTVLVYGGKSSAKTVSITQLLCKEAYVKLSNSIAFRKESTTIKTTLKKSFNLAIDKMYLYPAFEKLEFIYRCNLGSEIVLKGMDDEEKAKGVESYKYVYFDELNHFAQGEFEQADLSLRGIPGQKIFGSWNPVDENSWVKTELIDKNEWIDTNKFGTLPCENSFVRISADGSTLLIKTTFEDNYWINGRPDGNNGKDREFGYRDDSLLQRYEKLRTTNYNSYKVNVLGEWGKTVFGGEFLKCWRTELHTGNYPYNSKLPVHLIFDENVNPYFPCGIFQFEGKNIYLIHTIALKNPENTTAKMCIEINRKLKEWGHTQSVFVGGDPASKKDDVKQEKGNDLFRIIMNGLADWKPRRAVLHSHPSVRDSADFFNSILESEIQGLKFMVDKSCKIAIQDYENTKEDKNGKVDKKTVTDPVTKVSYQPYGHFVDLTRYFLIYTFPAEYGLYQRGNLAPTMLTGSNTHKNRY